MPHPRGGSSRSRADVRAPLCPHYACSWLARQQVSGRHHRVDLSCPQYSVAIKRYTQCPVYVHAMCTYAFYAFLVSLNFLEASVYR